MKKRKGKIKEISRVRLKKTRGSSSSKQISQSEPPDPWKEIRLKLQPLSKAYRSFMEQRKIAKQKRRTKKIKIIRGTAT